MKKRKTLTAITDKQRLDWLSKTKSCLDCYSIISSKDNPSWGIDEANRLYATPRQAIDAAIKASRKVGK